MHFVSAKGQASCTDCPTTNETGSIGCCPGNSDQWPLERGFSCLGRRYGVFLDTVNLRQFFEYVQCCKTLSGNKNIHVDIQAAGFWGLWLCAHFGFDVFHCWFVDQSFPSRIFQDEFTPWQECQCDACAEHWLPGGGQTELTFSDLFVSIVQKKKRSKPTVWLHDISMMKQTKNVDYSIWHIYDDLWRWWMWLTIIFWLSPGSPNSPWPLRYRWIQQLLGCTRSRSSRLALVCSNKFHKIIPG